MEPINSVNDLYLELIRDLYHAEVLLIPELRLFSTKTELRGFKKILDTHLADTRSHTSRLEEIQERLKVNMMQEHCRSMKSMIIETKEMVERCSDGRITERAILASLQRITSCIITVYEMLISMADELSLTKHKQILQQNLDTERNFMKKLKSFQTEISREEPNLLR